MWLWACGLNSSGPRFAHLLKGRDGQRASGVTCSAGWTPSHSGGGGGVRVHKSPTLGAKVMDGSGLGGLMVRDGGGGDEEGGQSIREGSTDIDWGRGAD